MADELLKRVMPNNVEAEQSVIGAMLMDRDAITIASEILTVDDFYQKQYGILFEAEFVRDMITKVPTSVNVGTYAKIVSEKAALRRLIRVNEEIASACYAGKDSVEEIMEDTEKKIFQVLQRKTNDEFVPIKDVVLNALDKIEAASRMKGSVTGMPTGFIDLDYKTSGFQPVLLWERRHLCRILQNIWRSAAMRPSRSSASRCPRSSS